jgi:hypothetical protein
LVASVLCKEFFEDDKEEIVLGRCVMDDSLGARGLKPYATIPLTGFTWQQAIMLFQELTWLMIAKKTKVWPNLLFEGGPVLYLWDTTNMAFEPA